MKGRTHRDGRAHAGVPGRARGDGCACLSDEACTLGWAAHAGLAGRAGRRGGPRMPDWPGAHAREMGRICCGGGPLMPDWPGAHVGVMGRARRSRGPRLPGWWAAHAEIAGHHAGVMGRACRGDGARAGMMAARWSCGPPVPEWLGVHVGVMGCARRVVGVLDQLRMAMASTSKSMSGRARAATPLRVCVGGWVPQISAILVPRMVSLVGSWSTMKVRSWATSV